MTARTNVLIDASDAAAANAIPVTPVTVATVAAVAASFGERTTRWTQATGFTGAPGTVALVAGEDGSIERVLVAIADKPDPYAIAQLPVQLPAGTYQLDPHAEFPCDATSLALGFALGSYQYTKYKAPRRAPARLVLPGGVDGMAVERLARAIFLVRDLVNTPTQDMGPADLESTVRALAREYGGACRAYIGPELLTANFPAIHAVGRASHNEPRLIELEWGDVQHPKLAIVGKGVCFDTGGLDIKPADGMRWMKKDMGGAAHAIALASLVMDAKLPVRLHLLVPAVENAIGPESYRPGEVIKTRAGISVEVDNTDAEGRIVLCDALTYAAERSPDLIIDIATLTGAARVALGPELPALFSNRDELAKAFVETAFAQNDPVWHMPLWKPYASYLDSMIADMANSGASRMAGAITAALYLDRFVPAAIPWCHFDTYSWNDIDRPGRPRGGEAQGLRAAFAFLRARYESR